MKKLLNKIGMFLTKNFIYCQLSHILKTTVKYFNRQLKDTRQQEQSYCIEHLKTMIHKLTDDINDFKYTPYLIEITCMKPLNKVEHIELYVPVLIDCINEKDVEKIGRNFSDTFNEDGYYTKFNPKTNIILGYKENKKDILDRVKQLMYDNFNDKVKSSYDKVKDSRYYLTVDLLEGRQTLRHSETKIYSSQDIDGLQVLVEEKVLIDILDTEK